jgi:hypothetical protein
LPFLFREVAGEPVDDFGFGLFFAGVFILELAIEDGFDESSSELSSESSSEPSIFFAGILRSKLASFVSPLGVAFLILIRGFVFTTGVISPDDADLVVPGVPLSPKLLPFLA